MIADSILKGALLKFKRAPFACQKGIFYNAKGRLLQHKKAPIENELWIIFTLITLQAILKERYSIRYKKQETPVSDEETKKEKPKEKLAKVINHA